MHAYELASHMLVHVTLPVTRTVITLSTVPSMYDAHYSMSVSTVAAWRNVKPRFSMYACIC